MSFASYSIYLTTLVLFGVFVNGLNGSFNLKNALSYRLKRATPCPDQTMCRSQWGYCGKGSEYCGTGCQAGPCITTTTPRTVATKIIDERNFACVFNTIDNRTRTARFNGFKQSGWQPVNQEEAAVFLAHVSHETDGLRTLREYCAPGCGSNYAASWCSIQGQKNKLYYGRGWFQLSWPCNYYGAGQALNIDLLANPDLVEQRNDLAVQTALWYYKANGIDVLAQQGDFAETTRKINGALECNGGPGAASQVQRVTIYRRVRTCFGLGAPTKNPSC